MMSIGSQHVEHVVQYILNDDDTNPDNVYWQVFHHHGIQNLSDFMNLTKEDMANIPVYASDNSAPLHK